MYRKKQYKQFGNICGFRYLLESCFSFLIFVKFNRSGKCSWESQGKREAIEPESLAQYNLKSNAPLHPLWSQISSFSNTFFFKKNYLSHYHAQTLDSPRTLWKIRSDECKYFTGKRIQEFYKGFWDSKFKKMKEGRERWREGG